MQANNPGKSRRLGWLNVRVVRNLEWTEGLSSSIRCGLSALRMDSGAAVITLCDRPSITASHIRALAASVLKGETRIAASAYDGVAGVPAAFAAVLFPTLLGLEGEAGARDLIRSATVGITLLTCERGNERSSAGIHQSLPSQPLPVVSAIAKGYRGPPRAPPDRKIIQLAV